MTTKWKWGTAAKATAITVSILAAAAILGVTTRTAYCLETDLRGFNHPEENYDNSCRPNGSAGLAYTIPFITEAPRVIAIIPLTPVNVVNGEATLVDNGSKEQRISVPKGTTLTLVLGPGIATWENGGVWADGPERTDGESETRGTRFKVPSSGYIELFPRIEGFQSINARGKSLDDGTTRSITIETVD